MVEGTLIIANDQPNGRKLVAEVLSHNESEDERRHEADVALISAAPDLLAAAKLAAEALGWLRHEHPEVDTDNDALKAAIARAEGR